MVVSSDVLIIGSGVAGLMAAARLARFGYEVAICTKQSIQDSSSYASVGGLYAPKPDEKDLGTQLKSSILQSGEGLCSESVVEDFVMNAYDECILPLLEEGIEFERTTNGTWMPIRKDYGSNFKEHSSGKFLVESLYNKLKKYNNVKIYHSHLAVDLITLHKSTPHIKVKSDDVCIGAYVLDVESNKVESFAAGVTILATGGAGRVYLYTSNSDSATGDGIAMYLRLGYPVHNMEFMEFAPTCLWNPNPKDPEERRFLLPEGLRTQLKGVITLSHDSKQDIITNYDKLGSASDHSLVSQAIDAEMKKNGLQHVYLNITPEATGHNLVDIWQTFPTVVKVCLSAGIDITKEPIPVVPAATYTYGGIPVDRNGHTVINRLYAIGETACTYLYGAKRTGGNALTEDIVWSVRAANHAHSVLSEKRFVSEVVPEWQIGTAVLPKDQVQVAYHWDEVRRLMWNLVGIARTGERLTMARRRLKTIAEEVNKYYWSYIVTSDLIELRNIIEVAQSIVCSATSRVTSTGVHFRLDDPTVCVPMSPIHKTYQ